MSESNEQNASASHEFAGGVRQGGWVAPPTATTIILVRHGESEAAVPGKPFPTVDGHGDPALHEEGHRQAALVAERFVGQHVDALYVTTLRRTHQTAAPIAGKLGLEPIVEPDLREVCLGEWDNGEFRVRAAQNDPVIVRMRAEQEWGVVPGAETNEQLMDRTQRALHRLVERHPGGRVVAVVHGGVIGSIVAAAVGANPFAFGGAENTSITELIIDTAFDPPRHLLRRFNDAAHLDAPSGPSPTTG